MTPIASRPAMMGTPSHDSVVAAPSEDRAAAIVSAKVPGAAALRVTTSEVRPRANLDRLASTRLPRSSHREADQVGGAVVEGDEHVMGLSGNIGAAGRRRDRRLP